MTEAVRHFRLLPTALPAEEKRIRTSYVPSLVLVLAFSSIIFIFIGTSQGATRGPMIRFGLIMAAYTAYVAFWSPRKMKRRLHKCWETYDLEIGQNYFLRRQADLPDLRLQFDEVQAVEHVPGRYLRVIGKPKSRVIGIAEGIEHFDQILEIVSSVRAVQVRSIQQWHKSRALMAAGLILYMIMLWATSPVVVIPLSLGMAAIIVWVFLWMHANPNIPARTKRIAWLYLLFLVMCALKFFIAIATYLPRHGARFPLP